MDTILLQQQLDQSHGREILHEFVRNENIDERVLQTFDTLTALYLGVNEVINISALTTIDDIYIKHYLDSIYPYKFFSGECCDVGCGGGFPCLPLAIMTGLNFTGIDSVGKKLTLIKKCVEELHLTNVTPVHDRSEDYAKKGHTFDTVCARAVANSDKVLGFCAPLLKDGGRLILYKTQNEDAAAPTIQKKFKVKLEQTIDYTLPSTNIQRRLFIYSK